MNNTRRKNLKAIHTRIHDTVEELRILATEEEEYRDNMHENMHGGEKYDRADTVAYTINDVADNLELTLEPLEESWAKH